LKLRLLAFLRILATALDPLLRQALLRIRPPFCSQTTAPGPSEREATTSSTAEDEYVDGATSVAVSIPAKSTPVFARISGLYFSPLDIHRTSWPGSVGFERGCERLAGVDVELAVCIR
jgi:hypothetical protein